MIVEKIKPCTPYVRPHKNVYEFTVGENLYNVVKYFNTNSYGVIITDTQTHAGRLYKPFLRMNSTSEVADALHMGRMFKAAQVVKQLSKQKHTTAP